MCSFYVSTFLMKADISLTQKITEYHAISKTLTTIEYHGML